MILLRTKTNLGQQFLGLALLETLVWTFIYQVNQVASFVEATENFLCWVNQQYLQQQYLQNHHNFCLDQLVNITHVLSNVLSMSWHHDDHHHHFQEWADYKLSWNPADYGENCWRWFSSLFIFDCSKNDCWLLIVSQKKYKKTPKKW